MNMKTKLLIVCLFSFFLVSCEKYEDFVNDFDYTTVYFAYQNPIRTVFSNNLQIEIGAVMGGRRENNAVETVSYRIAPELLTDANIVGTKKFTLLPEDYYTLSSPGTLTIPKGDFLGKTKLTLNADKFLQDPLAISNTYALPLLITGTSLDSVLVGSEEAAWKDRKDYTVIVIKYISQYHGIYYHRGQRIKYDSNGTLVDIFRYVTEKQEEEYIQNVVWNMSTLNANTLKSDGVGENTTVTGKTYALNLSIASDNKVSIADNAGSLIKNITDLGNSVFKPDQKTFILNYEYSADGYKYVMKDTLYFRNDGLKLDLW